jgi:EF hand
MKLAIITGALLVLSAGYAFAQQTPNATGNMTPNTMTSGRPSAVLSDDQCKSVWTMASPNGDTLSQDKATPYVINFHMVDSDNDGTIDANEFKAACAKGMIQRGDASTVKDMQGGGNMKPGQE